MTRPQNATPPHGEFPHYGMLCTAALGMMTLALYLRGSDMVTMLVPPIAGLAAMTFRWRTGSIGVLFLLVWLLAAQHSPALHPLFILQDILWIFTDTGIGVTRRYVPPALLGGREGFGLPELLLCAATWAYCAAHYRLLGVTRRIFPIDPRRRHRDSPHERRSPVLVDGREILTLLSALPLWIAMAWLCRRWLDRRDTELDIDKRWWQAMTLAWLFGMLFLIAAAFMRYAVRSLMRPDEAALFLQDTLWRETSREQRRITRWIAWARRRQQKKEEP
jgi:hypothetical protein